MRHALVWVPLASSLGIAACCVTPPPALKPQPTATTSASSAPSASQASAAAVGPIQKAYTAKAERIIASATKSRAAYDDLAFLSGRIGHRLSGSESLDRAIEWAVGVLKRDGHENVHTEKVKVPHWVRGSESASTTLPEKRALVILGLGGTIATPKGGVEADVMMVRSFEELEKRAAEAKDKIVLFDVPMATYSDEKGAGYGDVAKYRAKGPVAAAKLGAKAVLVRSLTAHSLRTPHTGGTNYEDGVTKIPAAAVTTEDASHLSRLLASGERVRVRLELSGKTLPDADSANVVADLKGSEKPEEMVIIGAHIDSWDVGEGAHDDGAGCVMVMQALTELRKLSMAPRRTIRVVLFTNEENGIKGALAYGEAHKAELPKIVAAFESDIGGFAPIGFNVEAPKERADAIIARTKDLVELLRPLGAVRVQPGFSGADLIPLVKGGVTGFGLVTDHRTYFDIHHTPADTFDKVDPDALAKNVAATAVLAYVVADMPDRIDAPLTQ
jgi:carboxypeptidase Q